MIRELNNTDQSIVEQFLSQYSETSMFMRSNMQKAGLEYHSKDFQGEYWGAFDHSNTLVGVIVHYWNGNIMVQSKNDQILDELTETLRQNISRPIAGIVGESKQSSQIIEYLRLENTLFAVNLNEKMFALDLDELKFPTTHLKGYHMIPVSQMERSILTQWMHDYEMEAFNKSEGPEFEAHIKNRVERMVAEDQCWALQVANKSISLSGFNAQLNDIVQLGPVWTPHENRSKGYARLVVALTLQQAKREGVNKALLFTDHPAAIKAYEVLGFKHIGYYRLALMKLPVDAPSSRRVTDESKILEELKSREPIFHHPEKFGTTQFDIEKQMCDQFWEVGASGKIYTKKDVVETLLQRYQDPDYEDIWETKDFQLTQIAKDSFLLTYYLLQNNKRMTRRATIWQKIQEDWKILYHQGTIVGGE